MAIKNSLSLIFVAAAVAAAFILLGEKANAITPGPARDLCKETDYQQLCRAAVKGITNPEMATEAAISAVIAETVSAKEVTKRLGTSRELDTCHDSLGYAIVSLRTAQKNVKEHDRVSLDKNLGAAVSDFASCDDAFAEIGRPSPLANNTRTLRHMTSNCMALATWLD